MKITKKNQKSTVKKKKGYDIKPTARQKEAFKKIVAEKGRNKGKILRELGYSETVATKPQKVTESKGFLQLLEEYLPDKLLAEKHNELLTIKRKKRTYKADGDVIEEEELDSMAVSKGLEMGYKLKGYYLKDNEQKKPTVTVNIEKSAEIQKALEDL